MVRFKVDLAKPGLPAVMLAGGFDDLSGPAILFVGPERVKFQVPIKHLAVIEFFDKALNGGFQEADTKTIDMPEDDPEAFRVFLRWLYQGIDDTTTVEASLQTWTRLLLMVDKWCLKEVALGLIKHIANVLHDQLKPSSLLRTYNNLWAGYELTKEHAFRYVFVHALHVESAKFKVNPTSIQKSPTIFLDVWRWTQLLRHVNTKTDQRVYLYEAHVGLDEDASHVEDQVLMWVLFPGEQLPKSFRSFGTGDRDTERWQNIQNHLAI